MNVTVTNTQGPGFILIYPQGGAQPTVSTLNYVAGQTIANAAVVPLGAGGGITVIAGVSGTDLILDTNGDYPAGVVTSLSGLSGDVTLAAGSNVTITPSGQTLTVAATGGPGGVLPVGSANQTLRNNGTGWAASSALTNDGTDVGLTGKLVLPSDARVSAGANQVLRANLGDNNTFLGVFAGNAITPGVVNTGFGFNALRNANSLSGGNTAVGGAALETMTSAHNNVAVGSSALENLITGNGNIAIGVNAGVNTETGNGNIVIGLNSGGNTVAGSNNIYLGASGSVDESGQIRVGTIGNITGGTVIVGISGFSSIGGAPVYVNAGGRLGTTTASSGKFKEDVRDIGAESDRLMHLRPVAFRYKPEYDPAGVPQYGLIAEEVAEVYPDLVECDSGGRPAGVRYHLLAPLLLNEVQKQRRNLQEQQAEIEQLKAELAKLEAHVGERP